jgi:hypothetical protein
MREHDPAGQMIRLNTKLLGTHKRRPCYIIFPDGHLMVASNWCFQFLGLTQALARLWWQPRLLFINWSSNPLFQHINYHEEYCFRPRFLRLSRCCWPPWGKWDHAIVNGLYHKWTGAKVSYEWLSLSYHTALLQSVLSRLLSLSGGKSITLPKGSSGTKPSVFGKPSGPAVRYTELHCFYQVSVVSDTIQICS